MHYTRNGHFNHLHVPDYWHNYWSKYPEGYTILEALFDWIGHVDKMVDKLNEYTDEHVSFKKSLEQLKEDMTDFAIHFDKEIHDIRVEFNSRLDNFLTEIYDNIGDITRDKMDEWLQDGTLENFLEAVEGHIDFLEQNTYKIGITNIQWRE